MADCPILFIAPIWADRMAWRIKAALADETPPQIEALIIRRKSE